MHPSRLARCASSHLRMTESSRCKPIQGKPMTKDYAEQRAQVLRNLDGLHYEVDAKRKIGFLWLDRPPLNVVSYAGQRQINAIMEGFGQDADVRVVVIRGKNGVYTSGGDVKA